MKTIKTTIETIRSQPDVIADQIEAAFKAERGRARVRTMGRSDALAAFTELDRLLAKSRDDDAMAYLTDYCDTVPNSYKGTPAADNMTFTVNLKTGEVTISAGRGYARSVSGGAGSAVTRRLAREGQAQGRHV